MQTLKKHDDHIFDFNKSLISDIRHKREARSKNAEVWFVSWYTFSIFFHVLKKSCWIRAVLSLSYCCVQSLDMFNGSSSPSQLDPSPSFSRVSLSSRLSDSVTLDSTLMKKDLLSLSAQQGR